MPSSSLDQARFMAACAHGAGYASCPPDKVSHEFNQADKGSALLHNAMRRHFAVGGPNMLPSNAQSPYLAALMARANGGGQPGVPPQQPQMPQRPMAAPPQQQGGALATAGRPMMPQGNGMSMRPGMQSMPGRPMMPSGGMPNPGMVNGAQPGMPGQMRPGMMPMRPAGGMPTGAPAMARGGRTHFDLGGPNLANYSAGSPLSSGMSSMMHSGIGGGMGNVGHAHVRMPRIPIADTLRNIDQGLHSPKMKIPHLAEGGMPPQIGGQPPQLGPQAIAALGMAMAHMQNQDHGSAAGALMSSPEAMKHPHVRAVAQHLRASKDIGPAHKVLSNLVNSLGSGAGQTAAPPVNAKPGAGGAKPQMSAGMPGGMKRGGASGKKKETRQSHPHREDTRR